MNLSGASYPIITSGTKFSFLFVLFDKICLKNDLIFFLSSIISIFIFSSGLNLCVYVASVVEISRKWVFLVRLKVPLQKKTI